MQTLNELRETTEALFRDGGSATPGLDWVKHLFVLFAPACRQTIQMGETVGVAWWDDWLSRGDGNVRLLRQGGRDVFGWRCDWMRVLLTATRAVQDSTGATNAEHLTAALSLLMREHPELPAHYGQTWRGLARYLLASPRVERGASEPVGMAIAFPLSSSAQFGRRNS
jgi:hypothetical protein